MNARLRIIRPNSLDPDNATVEIVVSDRKNKVTCTLPISMFASAIMGVSGMDCDMEITEI